MRNSLLDAGYWASIMGQELVESSLQPLQPVKVGRKNTIQFMCLTELGFSSADRFVVEVQDGRCILRRVEHGGLPIVKGKLTVSEEVRNVLSQPDADGAILVGRQGEAFMLPVFVKEHPPDPLGPRFIDELLPNRIIRHAIPGPARGEWTTEALHDLVEMICSEPFSVDPIPAIAQGDDWVGWMTRNRLLEQPVPEDDSFRADIVSGILQGQKGDGSWDTVPATAYAILRFLALGEDASGEAIQRAANWLLDLPEPEPRPGMWMLTQEYLEEWLCRRQPREQKAFVAGEIQRAAPDDEISFYCWNFPMHEQDQFRGQEAQRVVPICARHHPPACEPRITHISALVAEALMLCGYHSHPRLRRYVNTISHVGGMYGYWCGCGALGFYDSDMPASEEEPDFDVRSTTFDGSHDMSSWRWISSSSKCAGLANHTRQRTKDTALEPFCWYNIPGEDGLFALIGIGWQNGDCWAKTNRALSRHPSCSGSLTEHLATYQASRYQTSLGEWDQGFPAGMLAFLSLYNSNTAKSLVTKTIPWLREHQADDGLWHHEKLSQNDWGKLAEPLAPKLATYHIISALHKFGLMDRLRPS
ncbi:hypothetical protein ACFL6S_33070 [Candidatus Poribacteria bacterium]